ncbi:trans-sulfuration enzyme family protein [Fontibacter flavus]|uniref:Trans-sulfuration enzyme family protein n=1 Tax=Fontibacter flavus TaxID=654838 RepID=A0ABV6FNW8_9BACT
MKIETIAIHAGTIITDSNRPAIQPITTSTTFEHHEGSLIYTRANNPNRMALEQVLSRLENGEDAAAFSSGNAAAMAVYQALPAGSHIIAPDDMYHGIKKQLVEIFKGIHETSFVDMSDLQAVSDAIRENTKLIWIETPSNPLLKVTDIRAVVRIAKNAGLLVACDNTFATPIFQNPLDLGADLVMHSTTKFLGGHSDVLGGALVTKKKSEFWEKIKMVQHVGGAVPSPFDCYFLTRSIKTLPYRMKAHQQNAMALATFLENHPKVEKVFYPGLPSHDGYEVAASQMSGFSGVLSFTVVGGAEKADHLISKLKFFTNATSLGGVESLIERRAAVEGPDSQTPSNLVRVSVGLENIQDLLEDLEKGLA